MKLHLPVLLRKAIIACMLAVVTSFAQTISAATLTLGGDDSLSLDFADESTIPNLNNGSLQLSGGTTLQLSSCGEGDGKTYILLTGVSELLDAQGNVISLDSTNNAASRYFDATQPGSGFWANGTLQLNHGALQMVLHNETVKDANTITTRQENPSAYQYYAGVSFENIEYAVDSYASGGAIYGGSSSTITLIDNGSVVFEGNTASSSDDDAYGGAINGDDVTLSNNGSVTFSGNTASGSDAYGGAIYGDDVTLSNNGSVSFSQNALPFYDSYGSSHYACGGAIYVPHYGNIMLSNNGSVSFSQNAVSTSDYAYGGAIYNGNNFMLSNNGSVSFSQNAVSSSSSYARGGAIYGGMTMADNEEVSFSGNMASSPKSAYGGAIYGWVTMEDNGDVGFSGNTVSSTFNEVYGGAIYGDVTMEDNGDVTFSGNTASSTYNEAYGGAICGDVTMEDNGDVTFSENSSSYGGAIYGDVRLEGNGDVIFSENSSSYGGAIDGDVRLEGNGDVIFSENSSSYGGAIHGDSSSSITLSNNVSMTFSGNTASSSYNEVYGGAIYGDVRMEGNGDVTFGGNTAFSSGAWTAADGGAIYGGVTMTGNGTVTFSGNTASSSYSANGGAIHGEASSSITLSNNVSMTFSGNTASSTCNEVYGGAIYTTGNLSIRNNDSVEFFQNAEVRNGDYRLRCIYAGEGSGADISLSAAAGKRITFWDSIYIGEGSTFKLNEPYEGEAQQGDIIFTGATTVANLYTVKGNVAGTEEEIHLSRMTQVNTLTNLYGGLLGVEDGAIYRGRGITAMEDSAATVRVQNATLSHIGYNLIFHPGTTLELAGTNTIAGSVQMLGGSSLVFDNTLGYSTTGIIGSFSLAANVFLGLGDHAYGSNDVLLYVSDDVSGWNTANLIVQGNSYTSDSFTWVDNLLILNYDEDNFRRYFNGSVNYKERLAGDVLWHHYESVEFERNISSVSYNVYGGAIYGESGSSITLNHNCSVSFSGNMASDDGGAIYGESGSPITLNHNCSVSFSGNMASDDGGAIYGGAGGSITLNHNGSVTFNGNETSSYDDYDTRGGAIYGGAGGTISLNHNGSVTFSENKASSYDGYDTGGGAIYGDVSMEDNRTVSFSGNTATSASFGSSAYDGSAYGGAICGDVLMSGNGKVIFSGNKTSGRSVEGGVIYGDVMMSENGDVTFSRNTASSSVSVYGGVIYGDVMMLENGDVTFSRNTASSSVSVYGGAIHGTVTTMEGNEDVTFSGNTARSTNRSAYVRGGAIYGGTGSSITLNDNGSVTFSGNMAHSEGSSASGGAIYTLGDLSIRNNDSVLFEKNVEKSGSSYRLCSIYAYGNEISLSAAAGKSITFYDSVYIDSGVTVNLNQDYTYQAEDGSSVTIRQQGDIIFTGKYTEQHLNDLLEAAGAGRTATAQEILNSRITVVNAMTNLYGGRLRVEDGAVYKGYGITAHEDSGAVVRLSNASLRHTRNKMTFNRSTALSLQGINTTGGDLVMKSGSAFTFDISADNLSTAVLTHTGTLTLSGSITLNINTADSSLVHGQYMLLQVSDFGAVENWSNEILQMGDGSYTSSDFEWVDNTLCFNYSGQLLSALPPLPEIPEPPEEPELPDTPGGDEPGGELPGGDEPGGELPGGDEPGGELPGGDEPGGELPGEDEPGGELPGGDEPGGELPGGDEPEMPDTPVTPDKPEQLKPFRPGDSALVSSDIDKSMEVILNGKGTLTLVGKVNAGAITVNVDKNLTLKGDKKKGGSLVGEGDLSKKGKGTLTLNDGNSSWTGDTYLLAGTIKVKGTTSLGKGDVYLQGGTLNLGSKVIANDIVQEKSAAIKSGKKFTGTYTLEGGELQKGSTLNISKTATLESGTVNGTLSGTGKTEVTDNVKLGDKGKITTNSLNVTAGGTLTTSAKGLSMNSKASVVTVEEDASLNLGGKLSAKSLTVNDGTFKTSASKPAAVSLKGDMTLKGESTVQLNGKLSAVNLNVTDSSLVLKNAKPQSVSLKGNATLNNSTATINGKFSSVNMTLNNNSSLTLTAAKPQNLTVKQNLTIGSGSSLTLSGKLSAGSLTIKKDGMLTMTGSKPVTLKVKGALTLNEGSSIILNYSFVQGKTYKVLTFGSYSGSKDYYSIFGVDADDCTITNTGKALTLTVTGKWNPQTQQKAVAAETPVVAAAKNNPVADALVQSNWGQLEASRAFVNAMANRSMSVQLGNGERAVWASAIGASSRHSSAGGHAGADTNVSGGAFGLETQVGRASLLGMALGNSWTRVSAHGFGTIEQDTTHLGLYGQTNWRSGVTADWSAAYGRSDSETMGSDWSQKHLQLDVRVSYNHELNANTVLSPFAGLQYYASDSATVEGTDTGSLQNLRAEIGVAASRRMGKFGVYGEIAVHQDIARNNPVVDMVGTRSTGMNPGRTGLNFTVGASYDLNDRWSVNASYTGEYVENANVHSANVGATYKF